MMKPWTLPALLVAYLAFVVYGSLIPFEVRPYTLEQGLQRFAQIPWLRLGAASRADWVANIVLYIPLSFLACSTFAGPARTAAARLAIVFLVLGLCLAIAVAVEFTQVFFAPRTVSLNDLLAEAIGSLIGIGLWLSSRDRLARLGRDFRSGGPQSITASISAYLLLYLALALFPFDFLISWDELSAKLHSGNVGWLLADSSAGLLRGTAKLFGETVAIAPLGLFAAMLAGRAHLGRTFIAGALLGLVLELLQLTLVSGVSQGASVFFRAVGLTAGAFIGQQIHDRGLLPIARWANRLAVPLFPVYLLSLLAVSGWFANDVLGVAQGLPRFDWVQLVPFYFHYFTSEPVAMASLLANLAMYAPIGLYVWARRTAVPRARHLGAPQAAFWAASLALAVELSKLWLAGKHPDFTNLLIAAAGSTISYALAGWMALASVGGKRPSERPAVDSDVPRVAAATMQFRLKPLTLPKTGSLLAFSVLAGGLALHPLALPWVLPLLLAYGYALWRFPWSWLLLLPMLLPVLDLAPHTGRLLLDEFDLLILLTLGLAYWRNMTAPPAPWTSATTRFAVLLLLASALISTTLGLRPVLYEASLTLDNSHAALDAVLVAKGLFWPLLLVPLLRRIPEDRLARVREMLLAGLAAGLALLGLVVLLERHRFVGIGDFEGVFRVTGNFSGMNNGGAYIEAFIAISFPALVVWTLQQRQTLLRLLGIAGAALASYAMLVTFSRGGYAGLVVGLAIVALTFRRSMGKRGRHHGLWLAGLVLAVAAAATPVLLGGFAQGRLAQIERDLMVRVDHWRHAIGLMDAGPTTALLGMGFGQYPRTYLWRTDRTPPPGAFAVQHRDGARFLRLGTGDAYYLDQIPGLEADADYVLSMRVRFLGSQGTQKVSLCEKALLYSFRCNWFSLTAPPSADPGSWQELSTQVNTRGLGTTGRWPPPTLKFSLVYPDARGAVDIDTVSLRAADGGELLANGDFSQGLDHWLPATDRDLAWHTHQTQVEVYFAQGLLGIVAVLVGLIAAARVLLPRMRRGDPFAVAIGAGVAGFLTVGLLGSTLDTARTAFLFYLIVFSSNLVLRNKS